MSKMEEIEAIKQLKYKYFRCLDRKEWDGLAETLTEDATCAYDSGKYSFEGRDGILGFLTGALDNPRIISLHQGHHPEIELTSETTAKGTWYLEDYVIFAESNTAVRGAAFYFDEYVKIDGKWKIKTTGYQRTFEDFESREHVQHTTTMFDAQE